MIPGHKGGLPEASWHTTDKCGYTFSFVNTCQGFTTGISSFVLRLLTAASLEACSLLWADYCQKQGVVLAHHHLTRHTHSGHHPRYMFCINSVEPRGPFCLVIHWRASGYQLGGREDAWDLHSIILFLWLFDMMVPICRAWESTVLSTLDHLVSCLWGPNLSELLPEDKFDTL